MDPQQQQPTPEPQAPAPPPANDNWQAPPKPTLSNDPDPDGRKFHPMVVLQPGEQIIAAVKRHPFGIVSMYFMATVGIAAAAAMVLLLLPKLTEQYGLSSGQIAVYVYGLLSIVLILLLVILGIATSVYWQNEWVITTDSITQISQRGLFDRRVSQLSLENLEDVTVDQAGLIPHIFNFGTLKVETAGERSKFQFVYCPNPNEYARRILEVHEQFLELRRNVQQVRRP